MKDNTFYCEVDKKTFTAAGKRLSWTDPMIGPCWKMVAACPACGKQANELKVVMKAMKQDRTESSVDSVPLCPTGSCPFVN
jgi:hypothetical protein